MEYPTECVRHRPPGQGPYSFHAQPPPVASHKAFMAYHQRWQVRSVYIDTSSFHYFRLQYAVCRVNTFSAANQAAAPVKVCACRLVKGRQD